MVRLVSLTILLGLLAGAAHAAETHPFSVHDMLAMDRISDPQVSPDGKLVAFSLSVTDLDANRGRSDIYLAAVDGSMARRLTTDPASDSQPSCSPIAWLVLPTGCMAVILLDSDVQSLLRPMSPTGQDEYCSVG